MRVTYGSGLQEEGRRCKGRQGRDTCVMRAGRTLWGSRAPGRKGKGGGADSRKATKNKIQ